MALKSFLILIILLTGLNFVFAQTIPGTGPGIYQQSLIIQLQQQIQAMIIQTSYLKAENAILGLKLILSRNLQRADFGEDVKIVQEFLKLYPELYPEGLVTGYFGPATESAIKNFQKFYSLDQTGTIGPKTKTKILQAMANQVQAQEIKETTSAVTNLAMLISAATASTTATSTLSSATSTSSTLSNFNLPSSTSSISTSTSSSAPTNLSPLNLTGSISADSSTSSPEAEFYFNAPLAPLP